MEIVHTTSFETDIGACRVASTERGLAYVDLPHASGRGLGGWLKRRAPEADRVDDAEPNRAAIEQILEYLAGTREVFDLPLDLRGTPFQCEVWNALLAIPYGESRSYREVADAIGQPKALRAVGSASGANPVALIVPCHRVVATGGKLGGYAGGRDLKAHLLELERRHPGQGRLL
jgi:methylated-DNA-[protein]-cysteine S-methyltransferase